MKLSALMPFADNYTQMMSMTEKADRSIIQTVNFRRSPNNLVNHH